MVRRAVRWRASEGLLPNDIAAGEGTSRVVQRLPISNKASTISLDTLNVELQSSQAREQPCAYWCHCTQFHTARRSYKIVLLASNGAVFVWGPAGKVCKVRRKQLRPVLRSVVESVAVSTYNLDRVEISPVPLMPCQGHLHIPNEQNVLNY